MNSHEQQVINAAAQIRAKIGAITPQMAIILGSGLGGLAKHVQNPVIIPYRELPGFPILTVEGHSGEVIVGTLSGVPVILLKGRKHFYETDDAYPLKTMVRTMKALGVEILFLSNAAGSVNVHIPVAGLMAITDHINFMGMNPLVGANDDAFGPRFVPLGGAWDKALSALLHKTAEAQKIPLYHGVYMAFRGPNFETPAEIKMAQRMGADAVGMSTVPDCLIARHCGLRVVGCSMITNMGEGMSDEQLSHAHTLSNAAKGADDFEKLVIAFAEAVEAAGEELFA
jgi:xanthosine phosphorylase